MAKYFKETKIQRELSEGAFVMERITREIRQAYDITSISSSTLKLATMAEDGTPTKTVDFILSSGELEYRENDVFVSNLNSANLTIGGLSFTQINTTEGEAVKVVLTVQSENDNLGRSVDFYNTVSLRGAY
jgi:hypothetical protein